MIMDALLFFDGGMAANGTFAGTSVVSGTTFVVGNTFSANIIDVGQIASSALGLGRDIGAGENLFVAIEILTAFAGTGAAMQIVLESAPDNGSGAPGSFTALNFTSAFPIGQLVPGFIYSLAFPPVPPGQTQTVPKFYQLAYTVSGANMTAGQIAAQIVLRREELGPNLGYKSGYSNQYV